MSSDLSIRPRQHIWCNGDADLFRGLEIDDKLKLCRLLNWEVSRFCALENLVHISGGTPIQITDQGSISHEAAFLGKLSRGIHARQVLLERHLDNPLRVKSDQRTQDHQKRVGSHLWYFHKRLFNILGCLNLEGKKLQRKRLRSSARLLKYRRCDSFPRIPQRGQASQFWKRLSKDFHTLAAQIR